MPVVELITVPQYLAASFEHDAELVDGRLVDRSVPTYEHSIVQSFLVEALRQAVRNDPERCGWRVLPEQRLQTGRDRFRVPDTCIVENRPDADGTARTPPRLCIEILSPNDPASVCFRK